ncbi:MAG: endonuclease/exonuclease/phosphatase family protein, partial [Bdellovibrionota bacterium]
PVRFWSRVHFRFATKTIAALAAAQMIVFALIATYIEFEYIGKDRDRSVFSPPAEHLESLRSRAPVQNPRPRDPSLLRVLNFNAWEVEGWIPQFIVAASRDRELRLELIPPAVAELQPDIVILQEVWKYQTRLKLIDEFRRLGFAFAVHGSDSMMSWFGIGNGLLIVSRLPLDPDVESKTFSRETRFDEGPLFARKGVLKTRVKVGAERWIDLYATHTGGFTTEERNGAGYNFYSSEQQTKAHQTLELVDFITATNRSENLIVGADLNTHPYVFRNGAYVEGEFTPEYALLTCAGYPPGKVQAPSCLGLRDTFAMLHPSEHSAAYTYDTKENFYANTGTFSYEPRGRIDYIFSKGAGLDPVDSQVVLNQFELSDHYGLLTTFQLK